MTTVKPGLVDAGSAAVELLRTELEDLRESLHLDEQEADGHRERLAIVEGRITTLRARIRDIEQALRFLTEGVVVQP